MEGDKAEKAASSLQDISIHALRVEGDINTRICIGNKFIISIHALRVEGDGSNTFKVLEPCFIFLSTPSGWRATILSSLSTRQKAFLSTPSGWRATMRFLGLVQVTGLISIHALRVEGDRNVYDYLIHDTISIHALRVEGDGRSFPAPRSP